MSTPSARRSGTSSGSPREPDVCLFGHWSPDPPPGRLAQGTPPARTGRGPLSGRGLPDLFPQGGGVHPLLAGRLEEAQALGERALALAREHQERGNQAYALRLLGDIAARRDPPEGAPAVTH